ncbi:MAG: hypothetical protein IJ899_03065 [Blautia sp.]|nr:hypothetical protein [Blautia sp.]
MNKIYIEKNTNGDSRVADHEPTIEEFMQANTSHIVDVANLMQICAHELIDRSCRHDWTKLEEPYRTMFYKDLCATIRGEMNFTDGEWSKLHYTELERHHLSRHVPDDVDLFDVIEMLCDCVCAGKARNEEELYLPKIDPEVLNRAFQNTFQKLAECVEVKDVETPAE